MSFPNTCVFKKLAIGHMYIHAKKTKTKDKLKKLTEVENCIAYIFWQQGSETIN